MSWKEIILDDDLKDALDLSRDVFCAEIPESLSLKITKNSLANKTDCHAYMYKDEIVEITSMYKYDKVINRIVYFRYFFKWVSERNLEHFWDIMVRGNLIVLNRHPFIVRITKFGDSIMQEKFGISEKEYIKRITDAYAEFGIKVIEYDKYIEFELL